MKMYHLAIVLLVFSMAHASNLTSTAKATRTATPTPTPKPKKPNFVGDLEAKYNFVNDDTVIISKKGMMSGVGVPNMGDAFSWTLDFDIQVKFNGKIYNEKTSKPIVYFIFNRYTNMAGTGYGYEAGDKITFLIGDTRYPLGEATHEIGTFFNGALLESLTVKGSMKLLKIIASGEKVSGAISAKNVDASKAFTFNKDQAEYARAVLYILESLKTTPVNASANKP